MVYQADDDTKLFSSIGKFMSYGKVSGADLSWLHLHLTIKLFTSLKFEIAKDMFSDIANIVYPHPGS